MWDNEPERLEPVDAPQLESGAPIPNVLACEYSLIFTYGLQNPSLFDGEVPRTDTPIDRETFAVIVVSLCHAVRFGPPNDEAIHGHRLYHLGLRPYSAFEVMNSSWIAEMEMANRVHPYHDVGAYRTRRHFIFTFHDTTLEFVAHGFKVAFRRGPVKGLIGDLWDATEY